MKISILFLVQILILNLTFGQTYIDKKGKTQLWGAVKTQDLSKPAFAEWNEKYSKDYKPMLNIKDAEDFENLKVKIFLGTWCGDTKFLLPKFIKEWKNMGLDEDQLELIAVHLEGDLYKQGPGNETADLNIHRVPTFIFYQDQEELGRIVERTVFDLGTDMKSIANKLPYEERYQGQKIAHEFFQSFEGDSLLLKENYNMVYRKIRRELSSSSELNSYGYVLKAEKKIEEAEFIFYLNSRIFPYEPNVHDSYGEFLLEQGRLEEAKKEYTEVIRLKKEDKNAIKKLAEIYDLTDKVKL